MTTRRLIENVRAGQSAGRVLTEAASPAEDIALRYPKSVAALKGQDGMTSWDWVARQKSVEASASRALVFVSLVDQYLDDRCPDMLKPAFAACVRKVTASVAPRSILDAAEAGQLNAAVKTVARSLPARS